MYIDENTLWRFTVPQAGEVDSAESVEKRMVEIDHALIGPMNKDELTKNGARLYPSGYTDGNTSKYSTSKDAYWSRQEGRDIYVTRTHYHPTQTLVPHAENADHATRADEATHAGSASKLDHTITINGKPFDGSSNINISLDDIGDATRVFWGTQNPAANQNLPPANKLRRGDLYIKIIQ